eukprot:5272938-Lingulodinium_polyedra.AAC.1
MTVAIALNITVTIALAIFTTSNNDNNNNKAILSDIGMNTFGPKRAATFGIGARVGERALLCKEPRSVRSTR